MVHQNDTVTIVTTVTLILTTTTITELKSGYGVRVGDPGPEEDNFIEEVAISEEDRDQIYHNGMYIAIARMADDDDKCTGTCFNCKECGHMWRQCPQTL